MKKFVGIALLTLVPVIGMAADDQHPDWAFPVRDQSIPLPPPPSDGGQPMTVPGSKVSFTRAQLADATKVFADWFPEDHPQAPDVVALGKPMVRPCATCHTPAGFGHPEFRQSHRFDRRISASAICGVQRRLAQRRAHEQFCEGNPG